MTKKHLAISLLLTALLLVSVSAAAAFLIPAADKAKENGRPDNAPVIEKVSGHLVLSTPGLEKKIHIHYAKPPCNQNEVCEPELGENKSCSDCKTAGEEPTTSCYGFLGKGVKWKELPQSYVIDPSNSQGLDGNFIAETISNSAEEWNSHTSAWLYSGYSIDHEASWDNDKPDGRNELLFGNYQEPGVIAVTVTWGYFSGPPKTRKIIEFDVLFDTDFTWGDASADQSKMDVQNIATHEIGHGLGLDDLYEAGCTEETMYGYSNYGETKKRTLAAGDIIGLQKLYGS